MSTVVTDPPTAVRRTAAAGWTPAARAGAAIALAGGGVLWTVADLIGFGHSGAARPAFIADHPTLSAIGVCADMLGTTLLFFTLPVWLLLSRERSPRLAWIGAIASVFGMVAQAMIHGVDVIDYLLARHPGVDYAAFDRIINNSNDLPLMVFLVMFMVGAFAGTAVSMVALWRSRGLPRGSLVLWALFLALNIASVPVPTTVVALLGLVWMAIAILRSAPRHATLTA